MNTQTWIDWCQKQLSDLSLRLQRQGYAPEIIDYLNRWDPEFRANFNRFLEELDQAMNAMAAKPDGYHHFESFSKVKCSLLEFTNLHRDRFLVPELAQTA